MVPGGNVFSPLQLDGEAFVKGILVFLLGNMQLCGDKLHMITINRCSGTKSTNRETNH